MLNIFKPPPPSKKLPEDQVDASYKRLRLQVFLGIFIGYAGFYLIRKNFSLAMPELQELGFEKDHLGWALSAIAFAYGLSKFFMGSVSDRSNARVFLPFGLAASAILTAFLGLSPWAISSIAVMSVLLFLHGWLQGMGWPPCGRVMVHWFSTSERGVKMSIWNVAHNVGGLAMAPLAVLGMYLFSDNWRYGIFAFPAAVAMLVAIIAWLLIRDTPQSCGLPPIEIYKNDAKSDYSESHEKEFSTKQIFFENVLNNIPLWSIAVANAFVYFVRYGVLDWAPMYLGEVKNFEFNKGAFAYTSFEFAGIFGTLLCGWVSDKIFKGKRAPVNFIFMGLTIVFILLYWLYDGNNHSVDIFALFMIGFLIYGPIMMIGLQALDMVPKKAAGTAAGFTGLFGYFLGTAVFANVGMGYAIKHLSWNGTFCLLIAACIITMLIMAANAVVEYRHKK